MKKATVCAVFARKDNPKVRRVATLELPAEYHNPQNIKAVSMVMKEAGEASGEWILVEPPR